MATPDPSTNDARHYTYALFRENGVPFYIGKGRGRRWADHEMAARRGERGYKNAIIRDMQARGVKLVRIKIHEGLTETVAHSYEVALIAAIGRRPHGPLTNLTDGGEGFVGFKHVPGRKQTPEHIAKRSAARRGKKLSPEHIANMAATRRGRKASPETCAKMSVLRRGKKRSSESIAKGAAKMRGQKRSTASRANMSAGQRSSEARAEANARTAELNRGRKQSAEAIAKTAAANRGRKHSPEHVAKRMVAHIGKTRSAEAKANMTRAQRAIAERRRTNAIILAV